MNPIYLSDHAGVGVQVCYSIHLQCVSVGNFCASGRLCQLMKQRPLLTIISNCLYLVPHTPPIKFVRYAAGLAGALK